MASHVQVRSSGDGPHQIALDGIDPTALTALAVDLVPGEPPHVTISLDVDRLELDLLGVIDTPIGDVLRKVLADWEADPERAEAAAVETAALSERRGLAGSKGDTAIGLLRAIVNQLDALEA